MKTYFLALRNEDFIVSSNKWTTSSIDLYSNKFYTNYSVYRSQYGNNLIGDFTFTGTSVLSNTTPTITGAHTVTNYGEILNDQDYGEYYVFNYDEEENEFFFYNTEHATPYKILNPSAYLAVPRFVDTTSQIDIVRI